MFLRHTPQLKALAFDRRFDNTSRDVMRWRILGRNDAGRGPGTVLRWESAPAGIPGKCVEVVSFFGLEHIETHREAFCCRVFAAHEFQVRLIQLHQGPCKHGTRETHGRQYPDCVNLQHRH